MFTATLRCECAQPGLIDTMRKWSIGGLGSHLYICGGLTTPLPLHLLLHNNVACMTYRPEDILGLLWLLISLCISQVQDMNRYLSDFRALLSLQLTGIIFDSEMIVLNAYNFKLKPFFWPTKFSRKRPVDSLRKSSLILTEWCGADHGANQFCDSRWKWDPGLCHSLGA